MDADREITPTSSRSSAARTTLLVRVWLPDRPGALGAVASRIGAVGGDVHEIEVVDRGAGRAVDELVVTVPAACPLDLLAREIDEIDGVDIEEVEPVPAIPVDPRMQAFAAALDLAAAPDLVALARVLAEHARTEIRADHVAVVDAGRGEVIARSGDGPPEPWLDRLLPGDRRVGGRRRLTQRPGRGAGLGDGSGRGVDAGHGPAPGHAARPRATGPAGPDRPGGAPAGEVRSSLRAAGPARAAQVVSFVGRWEPGAVL